MCLLLSVFFIGCLFASILEPLFMVERFCGTKSFCLVIAGLALIMKVEINYDGMLCFSIDHIGVCLRS
jgi:hypothetical protein